MTATATHHAKPPSKRRTLVVTLAAAVALALILAGARMLRTHQSPLAPPTADIVDDVDVAASAPSQTQSDTSLAVPNEPAVPLASSNPHTNSIATANRIATANGSAAPSFNDTPAEPEPEVSAGAINEVMPDVPRRARQTIRGHVKVSVRLIVDQDGSVFAALVDDAGPSKYFSRLAIEAAKKWAFAPVDTDGQRLVQVRFDFTRDGTTAQAIPLK
jgi:TonB family protein